MQNGITKDESKSIANFVEATEHFYKTYNPYDPNGMEINGYEDARNDHERLKAMEEHRTWIDNHANDVLASLDIRITELKNELNIE